MARKDTDRDADRDAPKAKKPAVIEVNAAGGLSRGESMLYRLLPAGVVSAGLHLIVAVLAFVCTLVFKSDPVANARPEVDVAVVDKGDEARTENLTEELVTLDPNKGAVTLEDAKIDNVTVESTITAPDAGNANDLTVPRDSLNVFGSENPNQITPGSNVLTPGIGAKGGGDGGLAAAINPTFGGRGKASRDPLLKSGGGNTESEAAVARGLTWLALQQKKDGSWSYDGGGDAGAATGMGLLPFLAAGQTHTAPFNKDTNKYKVNVTEAIKFLLALQAKTGGGRFSDNAYAHAIATVALCEAFGMTNDKSLLKKPCQVAIDAIQDAQGPNGSWGYSAKADGDTSIVGWQVQALHSAKMSNLKVDPKVLEKTMKFLDSVASGSSKYKYGYNDVNSARPGLSAVGLLCRYYLNGWGPQNAGMKDGAAYLLKEHPPEKEKEFDLYYYYYATQVMHFVEGDAWHKDWNPKMRDMLIGKQINDPKKPNLHGSWDKDPTWIGNGGGRMGTTAMAVLTLEVYYRHLPTYKRGTGGLAELDGK